MFKFVSFVAIGLLSASLVGCGEKEEAVTVEEPAVVNQPAVIPASEMPGASAEEVQAVSGVVATPTEEVPATEESVKEVK